MLVLSVVPPEYAPAMAGAGDSTRREYQRRRQKDREARRRSFKRSLVIVLLTPFVVYGLVQAGGWALNHWLLSSMFPRESGVKGTQTVVSTSAARTFGFLFAGIATLRVAADLWAARPTTEAWRKGAEGEVMTGNILDRLPSGYIVLHDLRMPSSPANIDHVVIGPTGVFTLETKNYSSGVKIRRGVARHAGRSMDSVVAQANRQAEAMRAVLGSGVRAIVCVHGGDVDVEGWFSKPVVDGVWFCSGRGLVRIITRQEPELPSGEVSRLAALAEQRLGRAAPASPVIDASKPVNGQPCACGGHLVLRHRRADGSPFWGCSRYPACRRTVAV